MSLIRPRLNDYHNIPLRQEDIDFAIPFLDEDIPLYVDPFLLWKVPSMQDNALHTTLVTSFNNLGNQYKTDDSRTVSTLITLTECSEVGLGNSKTRKGKPIGEKTAHEILALFNNIPQISKNGFQHFEEIQLLIDNISRDRISDISCSILKSFLIDYTIQQCKKHNIPLEECQLDVFQYKNQRIISEKTALPINPIDYQPLIFVPKRWLRYIPWINYDDYFDNYYIKDVNKAYADKMNRVEILDFNRHNYDVVSRYTSIKEQNHDFTNDPLFTQIPILSAKRKLETIKKLPTGKGDNADKKYEDSMVQLLSSLLYPYLDFAQEQSRTDSGLQIRDLIFYNNRAYDFLQEVYDSYDCRQIVIELKNVHSVERDHINQLNRYLTSNFGRFGIIFTRNSAARNIYQNTISLWSGQRRCLLILNDLDLELMVDVYESKQRLPIEIIKRKYVQFTRDCPS